MIREQAIVGRVQRLLARVVTEVLAPTPLMLVLVLALIWHDSSTLTEAVLWTLLALPLTVLPLLYVLYEVRRQRLTDRHVRRREQRFRPIGVGVTCVMALLGALHLGHAPRDLTALLEALVIGLALAAAVTLRWKISGHTMIATLVIVALAVVFSLRLLALTPLIALVGWSRVEVNDHSTAQTIAGTLLGAVIAGVVFPMLR